MHIFHKFQYQLLPPNALHNSSSVGDSQNPYPVSSNKRSRKRKLFYDEDSDIVVIRKFFYLYRKYIYFIIYIIINFIAGHQNSS